MVTLIWLGLLAMAAIVGGAITAEGIRDLRAGADGWPVVVIGVCTVAVAGITGAAVIVFALI